MDKQRQDQPSEPRKARRPDWALIGAAVALALSLVLMVRSFTAPESPPPPAAGVSQRAPAAPPRPEPLVFVPLPADEARRINAAIPFASDRGPAARPFVATGMPDSVERAIDCLAAAMWYEAGEDDPGQRAVAQVVLNRVRHPAYPATVCGVVFQGAERATGCQFTFTCDGAMRRIPPADAFDRARQRARAMLAGSVAREVGLATHYHTDWVHPAWSAELEKIARVGTHLFFRWSGWWGQAAAMRQPYAANEPLTAQLAVLSPAHRGLPTPLATDTPLLANGLPEPVLKGEDQVELLMSPQRNGNVQALAALDRCADRPRCRITGYLADPLAPGGQGPVVFRYVRDRPSGVEQVRWDCTRFRRPTAVQCMNGAAPPPRAAARPPVHASTASSDNVAAGAAADMVGSAMGGAAAAVDGGAAGKAAGSPAR